MEKKKILLGLGVLIIVLLLVIGGFWIGKNKLNKEEVNQVKSMIALQSEKEKDFKIDGYTIDEPNVILNPYGNSPLTALIMFETDKEVEVTVTIKGDDKLSTFTHTFAKEKEHYLPIYGLYADRN